jgi:dynein heavy chain
MACIMAVQPRQSGGSAASAKDEIVLDLATNIEAKLPKRIDIERANPKIFAPDIRGRTPSLSVFLNQEIERFNKLLGVMRNTLDNLRKGVKGLVVMSEDLERMYNAFLNNQVRKS